MNNRIAIPVLLVCFFCGLLPLLAGEAVLPGGFKPCYVEGQITHAGSPLAEVQVVAYSQSGGMAIANNAPNGNYALGLAPGQWTIVATRDGYFCPVEYKTTLSGQDTRVINISMDKSTAFIEGMVVDESNRPIPRAWVMAMPDMFSDEGGEAGMETGPRSPSQIHQTNCDDKGNFRLQTMKGSYMLMANVAGYEMSPKNPRPTIPGMEDLPPEYASMMPAMQNMGIQVRVGEGETRRGVTIILRPAAQIAHPGTPGPDRDTPTATFTPRPNLLVGSAHLTPNNVLHWTRAQQIDEAKDPYYTVVRSTRDFAAADKGEVVTFQFQKNPYGEPKEDHYSFTDNTAIPGQIYYYAVYETGPSGPGPYSNTVLIETR